MAEGIALRYSNLHTFILPAQLYPSLSDDKLDFRSEDETENKGASLRLIANLGEFTLTFITAGDNWQYDNDYDTDISNVDIQGFLSGGAEQGGIYQTSEVETYFFSQEFRLDQNPLTTHDSYGVGDLSLGINEKDEDRYRVTLFVKNFADENYRSGLNDWRQLFGGAMSLTNTFARNSQRYYGIRAKFTF